MKVGIVTHAFYETFRTYFPGLKVIDQKNIKEEFDLIIFSGGEDINPEIYGQKNTYSSGVNKDRDDTERRVFDYKWNYESKVKFLGVCRGHQFLNAYFGGNLIQDINFEGLYHSGNHGLDFRSNQSFIPTTVNSMHHQGVNRLGDGFRILATYKGVIEASAHKNNRLISVQWHPEFMGDRNFFSFINKWTNNEETINLTDKFTLSAGGFIMYQQEQYMKYKVTKEENSNDLFSFYNRNAPPQVSRSTPVVQLEEEDEPEEDNEEPEEENEEIDFDTNSEEVQEVDNTVSYRVLTWDEITGGLPRFNSTHTTTSSSNTTNSL